MQFINYCAALPVATTPFEGEFKVRERALRPDPGQCALDPRLNAKVLRLMVSLSTSRRFQLLVLWPSELLRAPPNDTARVVSSRRISSRLVSSRLVSSRLVSSRLVASRCVALLAWGMRRLPRLLSIDRCVFVREVLITVYRLTLTNINSRVSRHRPEYLVTAQSISSPPRVSRHRPRSFHTTAEYLRRS